MAHIVIYWLMIHGFYVDYFCMYLIISTILGFIFRERVLLKNVAEEKTKAAFFAP